MAILKLPHLVVIEGVDGVGKTTLAKKIEREFGYRYIYPVPDPFKSIRQQVEELGDVEVRFWYYLASNMALQQVLQHMLTEDKKVVLDRYIYSTMASHQAMGATVDCVDLQKVPYVVPDLAILLTCSPEVRNERILSRGIEKKEYVQREGPILDETEHLIKRYNLLEINTTNLTEEQVFAEAKKLILTTAVRRYDYVETIRLTYSVGSFR